MNIEVYFQISNIAQLHINKDVRKCVLLYGTVQHSLSARPAFSVIGMRRKIHLYLLCRDWLFFTWNPSADTFHWRTEFVQFHYHHIL